MYIVKRPFKNLGRAYAVGSVITEPTEIKRFRGKLAEGKILYVAEKDYERTKKHFKEKYGVDIVELQSSADTQSVKEPATKKKVVKPVVKATDEQ